MRRLGGRTVEVHCQCPAEVAAAPVDVPAVAARVRACLAGAAD